ncbi:hypothetical protein Tco_1034254 [Tanacetum coccineum]
MANAEQAPARASPVRTDEQIVPRNRWVPIGKSNCYLNEEKSQRSPIFKIAVDILKQTNFFRAFTASSTIPAIYIQQFWDTIRFDSKARSYRCQLDEQWFNLNQDTLRDALQITPVDNNRAFSSPPTPDTLVEFVNEYISEMKESKVLQELILAMLQESKQVKKSAKNIFNRLQLTGILISETHCEGTKLQGKGKKVDVSLEKGDECEEKNLIQRQDEESDEDLIKKRRIVD